MRLGRWPLLALVFTVLSLLLVPRLSLDGDLVRLFPDDPAARALASYVRAFGGGDVTTVMVRGDSASEVASAADAIAEAARSRPEVLRITSQIESPNRRSDGGADGKEPTIDPTLAWAMADDESRAALAEAVGKGMDDRLADTRALLLAPGAGAESAYFTQDPLRLWPLVAERAKRFAATVGADASGALVADQGRARFLLVHARASSLRSNEAKALVEGLESAIAIGLRGHPGVRASVVGGAAIARDAEKMIRRDLYVSSAVSTLLVALAFVATFRRPRALVAVLPPLLAGTAWTAAVAALFPAGISAIAMGFGSVVIGVGLDTGVHVYAAVERLRRSPEHRDSPPETLASAARAEVQKPTMAAAIAAAFAFGSLALSKLPALRQLGLLCAAGEVLTAIAILSMTPSIAARLEHTPRAERSSLWARQFGAAITRPSARRATLGAIAGLAVLAAWLGPPRPSSAIVAVRPKELPSLAAQDEAIALASSTAASSGAASTNEVVQLQVLLSADATGPDADDALAADGEAIAAALEPERTARGWAIDALGSWLPSHRTIARRLAERDALSLPARADALEKSLGAAGFATEPFAPALEHLRKPATLAQATAMVDALGRGPLEPLIARHLARSADGHALLAIYVRGPKLAASAVEAVLRSRAPEAVTRSHAVVTGYPVLDASLRAALISDLPRIGWVALVLVVLAMRAALSRWRDVGVAMAALAVELLVVALCLRAFHVPIHVYDALVLPVLLGITVDESMFLLHALAHEPAPEALAREGRAIVATAVTTAAGFLALSFCRFPGLRDLGAVGLIGTLAGLVASLVVVPALARRPDPSRPPPAA